LLLAGCDEPRGDGPPVLELEGDRTVRLDPGVELHDVRIGMDGVRPATVRAGPGDVVRFIAADSRTHAVAFISEELTPEARSFLERTGQLRSPPLLAEGASWIVSLEGAPPGRFPFVSVSGDERGVVVVER